MPFRNEDSLGQLDALLPASPRFDYRPLALGRIGN